MDRSIKQRVRKRNTVHNFDPVAAATHPTNTSTTTRAAEVTIDLPVIAEKQLSTIIDVSTMGSKKVKKTQPSDATNAHGATRKSAFDAITHHLGKKCSPVDDDSMNTSKNAHVVSFHYGDLQYGCDKHAGCPMRFENTKMQERHYERGSFSYCCLSCKRVDRVVKFTTRTALVRHKVRYQEPTYLPDVET